MADKILIVDDDPEFVKFVQTVLEKAGFLVCPAASAQTAMHWLEEPVKPRLVILDIKLASEKPDGLDLCRKLKADPATQRLPVFILSSAADNASRIRARGVDADLILSKPIKPQDLVGAVRSLAEASPGGRRTALECGDLRIDPVQHAVSFKGKRLKQLSPALFEVLYLLGQHYPHTLSRKYILNSIERRPSRDREIDVLISRLRRALHKEFGLNFVTTITGQGYRLEIPIRQPAPPLS